MGLTTRRVVREPKGATTDGTHETNAISLCIDTELAGGTLTVLLAPALITVTLITDYFSAAALTFPSPDLNAHGRAYDLSSEFD